MLTRSKRASRQSRQSRRPSRKTSLFVLVRVPVDVFGDKFGIGCGHQAIALRDATRGKIPFQQRVLSYAGDRCQTACKPGSVHIVPCGTALGRPFLWDAHRCAPHATNPDDGAGMPLRLRCFRKGSFGRPYSVLLPVGFTLPLPLPVARCALAAPFHPCRQDVGLPLCRSGGLFSVALSLGSPPPAVSRHRIPVEPGLSSARELFDAAAVQPSGAPVSRAQRPASSGVDDDAERGDPCSRAGIGHAANRFLTPMPLKGAQHAGERRVGLAVRRHRVADGDQSLPDPHH